VNWNAAYAHQVGSPIVTLDFAAYDPSKPLVFLIGPPPMTGGTSVYTPGVCWSTYYGGDAEDQVLASDVKQGEGLFVGGLSFSTAITFPINIGQTYVAAYPAATIARFDDGDALIWSTFFGCSSYNQMVRGVAVRQSPTGSKVFAGGWTSESDFFLPPVQPPGWYVDDVSSGGEQGFLTAFDVANGEMYWSTYFGGVGSNVTNIDFDASGNLLVCGKNSGDLPTPTLTPPANSEYWPNSGGEDGFVSMLDAAQMQVLWSTYVGGSESDEVYSVRCSPGKRVISGFTYSTSIQDLSAGGTSAHNHATSSYSATGDIFLYEFTSSGEQVYGSYFSYGGVLGWQGLALNETNGDIVLVGYFLDGQNSMPVSTTAPWHQLASISAYEKGFLWRLGADHIVQYSTFIGAGNGTVQMSSVVAREDGVIFAAGLASASNLSTQSAAGLYTTSQLQGGGDAIVLSITASNWRAWCTYYGGNQDLYNFTERIRTLALRPDQRLYVAGTTRSSYDTQNNLFFPLNDEGNGAWWDPLLDAPTGVDVFVAAFCTDALLTAVSETTLDASNPWTASFTADGIVLGGLEGQIRFELFDDLGRLVTRNSVRAQPQGTTVPASSSLAPGTYLIRVDERVSKKVIVP
jgi:hypothetical protein